MAASRPRPTAKKSAPKRGGKPSARPAARKAAGKGAARGRARAAKPGAAASADADWRPQALARMRHLIQEADPDAVEEVKWRKPSNGMQGVATWSHAGLVCTGETYKDKVKLTFARGAALPDPAGLFNAADTGATRRAIDLRQGEAERVDAAAFKALVRAAAALNLSR